MVGLMIGWMDRGMMAGSVSRWECGCVYICTHVCAYICMYGLMEG